MKTKWIILMAAIVVALGWASSALHAKDGSFRTKVLAEAGKTFASSEDPDFVAYDQALREYVVTRIQKRYGVRLDPKSFSGFSLLEIEALLKCKKAGEPADAFLEKFKKKSK